MLANGNHICLAAIPKEQSKIYPNGEYGCNHTVKDIQYVLDHAITYENTNNKEEQLKGQLELSMYITENEVYQIPIN